MYVTNNTSLKICIKGRDIARVSYGSYVLMVNILSFSCGINEFFYHPFILSRF